MVPGDIAFKCNLAMMNDETGAVEHRRVDRTFDEEGPVLCEHLDGAPICASLRARTPQSPRSAYALCSKPRPFS